MDSKILLGKLLQRFQEKGVAKVERYNSFGFIRETGYKANPELYRSTPTVLRTLGITHVTSPVYGLLHLLKEEDFR